MTYFIELNQKQVSIYNEMMTLTKETHDYESFLRFNSYLHKEIDLNQSNANFDVKAYHVYNRDMDSFLVVFAEVKTNNYATSIDDSNDQTALIASKNGQVIFNSKLNEESKEIAYSFGMDKVGFYYYEIKTEIDYIHISLIDYEGIIFLDETINHQISEESLSNLIELGYVLTYNEDELKEMLDISDQTFVFVRNIFIVIALEIGLYYWIFRKK